MANPMRIIQDWMAVDRTYKKLLAICRKVLTRPEVTFTIPDTNLEKTHEISKERRWQVEIALKAAEKLCNTHREYSIVRFGDGLSIALTRDAEAIDPFFKGKNLQGGTLEIGGTVSTQKDLEKLASIPDGKA